MTESETDGSVSRDVSAYVIFDVSACARGLSLDLSRVSGECHGMVWVDCWRVPTLWA